MVRTRVRLLEAGVEVRQWATRLYRYADIADVKLDRATNDRTITLGFRDGRNRRLPAPTRGLRKPSDPTLLDAVDAIRERASFQPARRLP